MKIIVFFCTHVPLSASAGCGQARGTGSSFSICLISWGAKTNGARGWWWGGGGGGATLALYSLRPQWPSSSTGLPPPVVAPVPPPPSPSHGDPPAPTIVELGRRLLHSSDRVVRPYGLSWGNRLPPSRCQSLQKSSSPLRVPARDSTGCLSVRAGTSGATFL